MHTLLRIVGLILVGSFLVFSCPAQQFPNNSIRRLTVEDGLPQGWVTDFLQDKRGFIWMLCNGLYRYDGQNFKSFTPAIKNKQQPNIDEAVQLSIDDQQNIWISYLSGAVFQVSAITGQARLIDEEPAFHWLRQHYNHYFIAHLAGQHFAVTSTLLISFSAIDGSYTSIPLPPGEKFVSLGTFHQNQVFVTTTKALYRLQGNVLQKQLVYTPLPPMEQQQQDSLQINHFQPTGQVIEGQNGQLLIAVVGGICHYDVANRRATYQPVDGLTGRIRNFRKTQNGDVYFLLSGSLYRLGKDGQIGLAASPAPTPYSYPLLEDASGLLWISTSDATGLRLYNPHKTAFQSFPYKNGFSHDVLEPWLHNPMEDQDVGSYGFRCATNPQGDVWITSHVLTQYTKEVMDKYLVGRFDANGLQLINPGEGIAPLFICFRPSGDCWMLVKKNGEYYLARFDTARHTFDYRLQLNQLPRENGFLTSVGEQLALVEPDSLLLYNPTSKAVRVIYREDLGAYNGLLMAVADPANNHQLWIGTRGSGIIKLDVATGKTTTYTVANGLPDNTVYMIAPDKKGFFWCSSNRGIFRFHPRDGSVVSFTEKDGLQGNEFNRYHFLQTPDGHFIFGGTNGYTIFHPDSVQIDAFQPPAIVSEILVNNEPLGRAVPAYAASPVSSLPEIRLAYNQNFLTFDFSGLEYLSPDKLQYRYVLEGFDKGWIMAGKDANAKYTSVPPGQYTFKVNASNTSGIWAKEISAIRVIILPPWWKTWWAYCLYVLLLGGVVYALYRNWLRSERAKQQIILKQKEAAQLKEIDAIKNHFFDNITHEFRTPLSLILAPLEEVQNSDAPGFVKAKVNVAQRNAKRLLQLINQLLDLAKLEAASMKVELSRGNLAEFIQEIAESFLPRANGGQISLTYNVQVEDATYLFDRDKLQKILQNLLSNAVKFTPPGGSVQVAAHLQNTLEKQDLLIKVSDNGQGIPPDKMPFIFNRFYQADERHTQEGTGIGLALVKELAELLGGSIEAASDLVQKGTAFTLRIPIEKAEQNEGEMAVAVLPQKPITTEVLLQEDSVPANGSVENQPLILVAEDDAELNAFIANTFRQQYRVITATNGMAGWELAQKELPDLIISDARMPGMDGYTFCQQVKRSAATSHIGFILLTARSAPHNIIEGLQSQADDYITKPFSINELSLRVNNLLNRQQTLCNYFNKQLTQPNEPIVVNENQSAFLKQLYEYVEQHLDDPDLTVVSLAAAMSMSQRTLARKLSTLAGVSPIELIKQYRLKRAATLLQAGNSVAEAAYKVGYETVTYFSTSFKSFYGLTPTEYVKKK